MSLPRDYLPGLWLLKHPWGAYVPAIDGASSDCYMAFLTESEAVAEAYRQNEMYDLDCHAVRAVTTGSVDDHKAATAAGGGK
jgi:hypothetical protein